MADPESGSEDEDDYEEEEELREEVEPSRSLAPGNRTPTTLGRSKTSILARPKPKGARPPRRHMSIAGSHTSGGRRVTSIFNSPSFRHASNSLAPPSNGGENSTGVVGRGRSNSQVSVKDALLEEILTEEREARTKERKEEAELTEKEGSRLKRFVFLSLLSSSRLSMTESVSYFSFLQGWLDDAESSGCHELVFVVFSLFISFQNQYIPTRFTIPL